MTKKEEKAAEQELENEIKAEDAKEQGTSEEEESAFEEEPDLEAKINELNDKYLRLYSEFDNFRRRTAKERLELLNTAGEEIFVNLLPVLDDFERAIESNKEAKDIKAVNEGIQLIYNKFKATLEQKGLEELSSKGETFDTDLHEAITNAPAPSDDLKGKVVDELEKGYKLNGKIIRFAKVIIGN